MRYSASLLALALLSDHTHPDRCRPERAEGYGDERDGSGKRFLEEGRQPLKVAGQNLHELDDWRARLREGRVTLSLPRFSVQDKPNAQRALAHMGLDLFRADFSGVCRGMTFESIEHIAKMEVDERGTKAAAVTVLTQTISEPPAVTCDRPFLVVIRENTTGGILFLGRVCRPAKG